MCDGVRAGENPVPHCGVHLLPQSSPPVDGGRSAGNVHTPPTGARTTPFASYAVVAAPEASDGLGGQMRFGTRFAVRAADGWQSQAIALRRGWMPRHAPELIYVRARNTRQ